MTRLRLHSPGSRWHGTDVSGAMPGAAIVDDAFFGLIGDDVADLLDDALSLHHAPNAFPSRVTVLVAPAPPPRDMIERGPLIESFLVSGAIAQGLSRCTGAPSTWCFHALKSALAGPRQMTDIQIVDKRPKVPRAIESSSTCETVLSHRGPERYLRLCADSLLAQTLPVTISIGIDQKYCCPRFLEDVAERGNVHAFGVDPHPVGPFVSLHVLSTRASARAHYVMRQDTDDFAMPQRAAMLTKACSELGVGFVGSNILTVDEITQQVIPARFPPDVNHALRASGADHHLYLPSSVCSRDGFAASEGFSTVRIFAHDVDHWLRASFRVGIRNIDEFLYIRRRHDRSLTTRADVGMASAARTAVRDAWKADYRAVSAGEKALDSTSIALRHRPGVVAFRDLRTGVTQSETLLRAQS